MKLTASNDRYHVHWAAHVKQGRSAAQWCHESFGAGWDYDVSPPDSRYHADHHFIFAKLYHAQWFMAKWTA